MSLYLPGAKWCPISYRAEAGSFSASNPLGYIPHVQQGNGALYGYFNRLVSPNRKFSTAWIAKDGRSEQYTELTHKAWAQGAGNGFYWSFETEGFTTEPYTGAQIETLARWHNFLRTPDVIVDRPGLRGIGTHRMGGESYGGHSCPGDIRAGQRKLIIARARVMRGDRAAPVVSRDETRAPLPTKPAAKPAAGKLDVDGDLGRATISRWQQVMGTPVDGVISKPSSSLIKAVQWRLAVTVDGDFGPLTTKAVQRRLGVTADGDFGPRSVKALQTRLNSGKF